MALSGTCRRSGRHYIWCISALQATTGSVSPILCRGGSLRHSVSAACRIPGAPIRDALTPRQALPARTLRAGTQGNQAFQRGFPRHAACGLGFGVEGFEKLRRPASSTRRGRGQVSVQNRPEHPRENTEAASPTCAAAVASRSPVLDRACAPGPRVRDRQPA